MRKFGLLLLPTLALTVFVLVSRWKEINTFPTQQEPPTPEEIVTEIVGPETTDWDRFISAVIWKESKDVEDCIGDNGKAVGVLQIHPIMVREANRILAMSDPSLSNYYTYNDRYSREKSIEIFKVVQGYHNPKRDHRKALQIWNHGHPASYYNDIMWKYRNS